MAGSFCLFVIFFVYIKDVFGKKEILYETEVLRCLRNSSFGFCCLL